MTQLNLGSVAQEKLFALADENYADFQSRLIPSVPRENIIGVRIPCLRKFAKLYFKDEDSHFFLRALPHKFYDENMLHALVVCEIKDYSLCVEQAEYFLPYIDNWAVCDALSPKIFKKNRRQLLGKIREWVNSNHVYTCRFGVKMLMHHYFDEEFVVDYLKIPASIHSEEYYVNTMIAWYYTTALVKQWDSAIPYLENRILDVCVHNMTIQKALESARIMNTQREYLKKLKL